MPNEKWSPEFKEAVDALIEHSPCSGCGQWPEDCQCEPFDDDPVDLDPCFDRDEGFGDL
jgi:hypothetical protein